MSTLVPPAKSRWWRIVDWRMVGAIGLPIWAFLFGMLVSERPAPVVVAGPIEPPRVVDEEIPMPRAIVVREREPEIVTVPVVVPVPVPAEPIVIVEPAPAIEFKLPDTELMPAQKCKKFGTKILFHDSAVEAAAEAKALKKMMLVLHISGNFEDPGFT